MKKQTLIGIIIGLVIFVILALLYVNYSNKISDESNGFDEELYAKYENRGQEKIIFNQGENNIAQVNGLNLELDSYKIDNDEIKFNVLIYPSPEDLETKYDYNTINFSYYVYDDNFNILTNKLSSEKSHLVEPFFYKEHRNGVPQKSLAEYRDYIHENYNVFSKMNFSFDNDHTCNYEIVLKDENISKNIEDLYLVIYDLNYEYSTMETVHYDTGDVEEEKANKVLVENKYYEFMVSK